METNSIKIDSPLLVVSEDMVCPNCGNELYKIDGKLYCENCGVREI